MKLTISLIVTALLGTGVAFATRWLFARKPRLWWVPIAATFLVLVVPSVHLMIDNYLNYNLKSRRSSVRHRLEGAREQILACRATAGCDPRQFSSALLSSARLYVGGRVVSSAGQDLAPTDAESKKVRSLCPGGEPIAITAPYLPDAPEVWLISDFGVSRLCSD